MPRRNASRKFGSHKIEDVISIIRTMVDRDILDVEDLITSKESLISFLNSVIYDYQNSIINDAHKLHFFVDHQEAICKTIYNDYLRIMKFL